MERMNANVRLITFGMSFGFNAFSMLEPAKERFVEWGLRIRWVNNWRLEYAINTDLTHTAIYDSLVVINILSGERIAKT